MIFQIKHRHTAVLLFEGKFDSLIKCAEAAVIAGADLSGADLSDAHLSGAHLSRANLSDANLSGADLSRAHLFRADLFRADLYGADLSRANLSRANLSGTYLDSANVPNQYGIGKFELVDSENSIYRGYRTQDSPTIGGPGYEFGRWYQAPWFSTAGTECHPGLYLRPKKDDGDISVLFCGDDLHGAGGKFRVRKFVVEEGALEEKIRKEKVRK